MKKTAVSLFTIVAILGLTASPAWASEIPSGQIRTDEMNNMTSFDSWPDGTITLHPDETPADITGDGGFAAATGQWWSEPVSLPLTNGPVDETFNFDNNQITFVLTDIEFAVYNPFFADVLGIGYFEEAGWDNTPGSFTLAASDASGMYGADGSSASETTLAIAPPVPEPSSLALLGSGLLGMALLLFRKGSARRRATA